MKYLYFLIVSFFLLITTSGYFGTGIFAQDVQEQVPDENIAQQTEEPAPVENSTTQVDEDVEALQNDLLLKLPEETDNPNYTILFTDPSGKGVSLSIDGAEKVPIQSPYSLPALGIGKHAIQFTYTNLEDAESTYETSITIIPRPPEIKPPEITNNQLTFSGTAIPAGTLKLFLTGAAVTYRETVKVEDGGNWSVQLSGDFQEAVYTATAYVTKNGFGSDFSEPVTFNIGTSNNVITPEDTAGQLDFALSYILVPDFYNRYLESRDLLLYTLFILILGLLFGVLIHRFFFVRGERSLENKFKSMLSNDDKDKGNDKKGKKNKEKNGEWIDTKPKEEDELPVFTKENEIDQAVDQAVEDAPPVEIDEGGETANVAPEEEVSGSSEVVEEGVLEEAVVEEVPAEEAEYVEDPNEEVPEYVASSAVETEEVQEENLEATDAEVPPEELISEENVESEATEQVMENADGSIEEAQTEIPAEPTEEVIEPPSEALAENEEKSDGKGEKLGIFSFLSRKNKKKDEKKEEDTAAPKEVAEDKPSESVEEMEQSKELSREEFLEQFKNYDPDPDVEERKGSMSEKLETSENEKLDDSQPVQVEETPQSSVAVPTPTQKAVPEMLVDDEGDAEKPKTAKKSSAKKSKTTKKSTAKSTSTTKGKKKATRKKGAARRNIKITLTSKD